MGSSGRNKSAMLLGISTNALEVKGAKRNTSIALKRAADSLLILKELSVPGPVGNLAGGLTQNSDSCAYIYGERNEMRFLVQLTISVMQINNLKCFNIKKHNMPFHC